MAKDTREDIQVALGSERPIPAEQVRGLYDHVGWWPDRRLDEIADVLARGPTVAAWHGSRVIGFARAVHDTAFRAYVEDVLVHADYRRQGVAGRLLARLLDELSHIETISLFCDPAVAGLYEAHGFQRLPRPEVVLHRRRVQCTEFVSMSQNACSENRGSSGYSVESLRDPGAIDRAMRRLTDAVEQALYETRLTEDELSALFDLRKSLHDGI